MVDATSIVEGAVQQPTTVTYGLRWKVVEATISTDETIPITGLGTVVRATGLRKDTGALIVCTCATTVVTVTSVLADVACVIVVIGAVP